MTERRQNDSRGQTGGRSTTEMKRNYDERKTYCEKLCYQL